MEYCEDDEAKLNPEDHNITLEERHSQPYMECITNSDTLFNLTTSPQWSLDRQWLHSSTPNLGELSNENELAEGHQDNQIDGASMLSPFRSTLTLKERAHRLITNIFETKLDKLRMKSKSNAKKNLSIKKALKKFTIKELAYDYKKANADMLKQLNTHQKLD